MALERGKGRKEGNPQEEREKQKEKACDQLLAVAQDTQEFNALLTALVPCRENNATLLYCIINL